MNWPSFTVVMLGMLAAQPAVEADEFSQLLASYGNLSTIAGAGLLDNATEQSEWQAFFEGGLATSVELSRPHMAQADAFGNVYIADKESQAILKVTPDGLIHTVAGTHVKGYDGDGVATQHKLNNPNGLFVFPDGTFYIHDYLNGRIRKVDTAGNMTTVVLDNPLGVPGGRGLWVSPAQDLIYYGADVQVKKWTPAGGIQTVATGFAELGNFDMDPAGNLVVTDRGGSRVYRIGAGGSKTIIAGDGSTSHGGDGFAALSTGLYGVRGIAYLPNGGYFLITHEGNQVWYVDTGGIIHLVIRGSTGNLHQGDGRPLIYKLTDTNYYKITAGRAIVIAPNGDIIITTNDQGYVRMVKSLAAPPQATITSTQYLPVTGFTLNWTGPALKSWIVERSLDLTAGSWQTVGVRTADSTGFATFTDPPPAGVRGCYYRVKPPQ